MTAAPPTAAIRIAPEAPHGDDVAYCLRAYFDDLEPLFGTRLELAEHPLAAGLVPPRGVFLMARRGDEPVGCGVLSTESEGVGYLSRMWVHRSVRGQGLGRRILEALEDHARRFGLRKLRLYTHRSLAAAQSLYRRSGYREVAPFYDDAPFADHFFEKDLRPESSAVG